MRCAVALAVIAFALGQVGSVAAAPSAVQVRRAADAFDDGVTAYRAGRYELAASHFEAANDAVATPRALRMAIRARQRADQHARSATLAAAALERYPKNSAVAELARAVVATAGPKLLKIEVSCAAPCVLALGSRVVPGKPSQAWTVYAEAGEVEVSASFQERGVGTGQKVSGQAGQELAMRFEPKVSAPAPASTLNETPAKPLVGAADLLASDAEAPPAWWQSPTIVVGGAVVTGVLGGLTLWSGVDTVSAPGTVAVRESCAGQGTECPAYQEGRDKQARTNAFLGATAVTAVLTAGMGLFVTRWHGGSGDQAASATLTLSPGGFAVEGRF